MVYRTSFRIIVFFIIALTRFRFPRKESLVTIVRRRYGVDTVKLMRKFEKTDKKLRKAELDHNFLKKCEELLTIPKCLNFKVTNEHLKNSPSYESCQRVLLREEINFKESSISELKDQLQSLKDELQLKMNVIDYTHIVSCSSQINDKCINTHRDIQDKKLCTLLEKGRVFQNDPDKVIHNLSNYELSSIEKAVLVKGLNYSINPGKLNYGDYCINFELLFRDIKNNANLSAYNLDQVKSKLKEAALSSYNEHNKSPNKYSNLSKEEFHALSILSKNETLIIQKSDRGNAIVILIGLTI